jgi:hypothetical protein
MERALLLMYCFILIAGRYALVGVETHAFLRAFWQNENVGRFVCPWKAIADRRGIMPRLFGLTPSWKVFPVAGGGRPPHGDRVNSGRIRGSRRSLRSADRQ